MHFAENPAVSKSLPSGVLQVLYFLCQVGARMMIISTVNVIAVIMCGKWISIFKSRPVKEMIFL